MKKISGYLTAYLEWLVWSAALSMLISIPAAAAFFNENEGGAKSFSPQLDLTQTSLAPTDLWRDVDERTLWGQAAERRIIPDQYRLVAADMAVLDGLLAQAPLENPASPQTMTVILTVPLPNGAFGRFLLEESPVMDPALGAKYPKIRTYRGKGLDDPTATARFDRTPAGFHGMILSAGDTVYIDPYRQADVVHYMSYYKRDYQPASGRLVPEATPLEKDQVEQRPKTAAAVTGPILRTYRLALAATGEYTQFHGGTVADGLAAMTTALNRVNGIYIREVAVQMLLIANNDLLIYTDGATDPYTNSSGGMMLGENQANIDSLIGDANYDIGHVFSTGGGGIASLRVPCASGSKARGVTGLPAPVGDPFYVDYVAHEMGHQFGAWHTFNGQAGSCFASRTASSAYEPGSASTIMGYAGICGIQNLQPHSDDYFHAVSFDEIVAFITDPAQGDSCALKSATGNKAPTVNAGPNYTIPAQTPFVLNGSATDPDGDSLMYQWEEFDLGASSNEALPDTDADGSPRPIFRSFKPISLSARTFPTLTNVLDGAHFNSGEALPTIDRTMRFRLTVRDGLGGVANDELALTVVGVAGPFAVTTPNSAVSWTGLTPEAIAWDVAGTTAPPIDCAAVDILLSTDGGYTFPLILATNTANDGTEIITVPNKETAQGRVKVQCPGNIFFDISNADLVITRVPAPELSISKMVSTLHSPAERGDIITYTVVIANSGELAAQNVQVTDTLPSGVSGAPAVLAELVTVAPGDKMTFTLKAVVTAISQTVTNTAYFNHPSSSGSDSAMFVVRGRPTIYFPVVFKE